MWACARLLFERIQFFITILVHFIFASIFLCFCDLFCTHGRVQNKHKLWKRAWIRRTASVRLHPQCSNIYFSFSHLFMLGFFSPVVYSLVEFNFFPFWNFLFFSISRFLFVSLTHPFWQYFIFFLSILSRKMHFGVFVIVVIFIYFALSMRSIFVCWMCASNVFVVDVSWIKNGIFVCRTQIISSKGQFFCCRFI